jgi:hypothetical protein
MVRQVDEAEGGGLAARRMEEEEGSRPTTGPGCSGAGSGGARQGI